MRGYLSWLEAPSLATTARFDLPDPRGRDVLVEVRRAHVCGSDIGIWRGNHAKFSHPPLGHEFVGRVLAMGPEVTTDRAGTPLTLGDRVVATYFPVCQNCRSCTEGRFGSCERAYAYRGAPISDPPNFHGAFASHYYVHGDQHLYRVPDTVSTKAAALANCGLATVLQAVDSLPPARGAVAVVLGLGGLGVLACATLSAVGWSVVGVDPLLDRRETAVEFRARATAPTLNEALRSPVPDLDGFDGPRLVVDVSGQPGAFAEGLAALAPHGILVEMGTVDQGAHLAASVVPATIVRNQLTMRGSFRYQPSGLKRALDFLAGDGSTLPYASLSPKPFALDNVQEAMTAAAAREQVRVALIPDGSEDE